MKRFTSILPILVVAALLSGLAVVYGPTEASGPVKCLRIGVQPITTQLAEMTAMAKGWWEKDLAKFGVQKVTDREFPSGPPEMQAMMAGDLDIAYVGATPPIVAIDQGLKAKIVAGTQIQGSALVLSPSLAKQYKKLEKIEKGKGVEALKGKTIATLPPGSIHDTILRRWLIQNSVDPEKDLGIISMDGGGAVSALIAGAIDGFFMPPANPAIAASKGAGEIVIRSGEMWPQHAESCLVVTDRLIHEHPDLVREVIKIHIKATVYNINHPDEAAQIYAERVGWDVDKVKLSFELWDGHWVHDPYIGLDCTLEYAKVLYGLGFTDGLLTQEDLFDTSLYDSVVQEILTEY
jgi:NitT/TauT family transport system substrate-binding protein